MRRRTIRPLLAILLAAGLGLAVGVGYATAADLIRSADTRAAAPLAQAPYQGPAVPAAVTAPPTSPPARPGDQPQQAEDPAPATSPPPRVLWELDSQGDSVRELEARLAQLKLMSTEWVDGSYGTATRAAVSALQTKAGLEPTGKVDERTWDELVSRTHQPTKGELHPAKPGEGPVTLKLDQRCLTGRVLCIDKSTRRLAWVIDGKVTTTLAVRFGSQFTPTREGQFTVYWKSRDHVSTLYGSAMPYAMFFSRGQAVHYSSDFAARGYAGASHGCVNVRDKATLAVLFDQVKVGDKVVVYRS